MGSCNCPDPPGGGISCEPGQLAICRVTGFGCHGECHAPPRGLVNDIRNLRAWSFSVISGRRFQPLGPQEEAILDRGVYRDPITGEVVRFSLP